MKKTIHFTVLVLCSILFTSCPNEDDEKELPEEEKETYCLLDIFQDGSWWKEISEEYEFDDNRRLYRLNYLDSLNQSTGEYILFIDVDTDGKTDRIEDYRENELYATYNITYEDRVGGGEIAIETLESTTNEYRYEFDEHSRLLKYTRSWTSNDVRKTVYYTYNWENDNVVQMTLNNSVGTQSHNYYEYDDKKNPFYHMDNGWQMYVYNYYYPRSKNNPLVIQDDIDKKSTAKPQGVYSYQYTYDQYDYPVSAILTYDDEVWNLEYSYTKCELFTIE